MRLTLEQIARATGGRILKTEQESFNAFGIDSRKIGQGDLFFAIRGEHTDGHLFVADAFQRGAGGAIVDQPGFSAEGGRTIIQVQDSMKALQDLGAFVRRENTARFIGITGSSGKTSTKEFTAALLSQRYRVFKSEGNLNSLTGLPLSLLSLESCECAVFEVAMNNPGEIARLSSVLKPDIGAILNVNPVHSLQFPSIDAIADEKCSLVEGMARDSLLVFNADDPLLLERLQKRQAGFTYGFSSGADLRITDVRMKGVSGSQAVFRWNQEHVEVHTALCGIGNITNIACAVAVAVNLNLTSEEIGRGINELKPYQQRGVLITSGDIAIYDDTYNSNPRAVDLALRIVSESRGYRRRIAVLGDMLELGAGEKQFHEAAGEQVAAGGFDALVTAGPLSRHTAEAAQRKGVKAVYAEKDSTEAAERIKSIARPGDLILVKGSRGMKMETVVKRLQTAGAE